MVDGYRVTSLVYFGFNIGIWAVLKYFAGFREEFWLRFGGACLMLITGFFPTNKNLTLVHKVFIEVTFNIVLVVTFVYLLLANQVNTYWFGSMIFGGVCIGLKSQPITGFFGYVLSSSLVTYFMYDQLTSDELTQSLLAHVVAMMLFVITQMAKILFQMSSDEVMRLREEAKRKEYIEKRQQTRFLTLQETAFSMAHEINNPLAIVSGNLTILKSAIKKDNKEKAERVIQKIMEAASRIRIVIADLKNFSEKLTQEQVILEFDVKQIIEEAIKVAKQRKGLGTVVNHKHIGNGTITANQSLISLIMYTLLDNSMDRLDQVDGGDVEIMTKVEGEKLKITFSDSVEVPYDLNSTTFENISVWLDKNEGVMFQKDDKRCSLEFELKLESLDKVAVDQSGNEEQSGVKPVEQKGGQQEPT